MASDMKEIYNAIPVSNLVRESSLEKVMLELRCEGWIRSHGRVKDEPLVLPVYLQVLKIFDSFTSEMTSHCCFGLNCVFE